MAAWSVGTKWEQVENFTSGNAKDTIINYTAQTPTPYLSTNGSIDVAMVGSISLTAGNMIANGEIITDYIEVKVSSGTTEVYPYDVTLEIGGNNVTTYTNYLMDRITIGSSDGLVQALQDHIDGATVMPGNLTIPLNISPCIAVGNHAEFTPSHQSADFLISRNAAGRIAIGYCTRVNRQVEPVTIRSDQSADTPIARNVAF